MTHGPESFRVAPSTIPGAGRGLFARVPVAVGDTIGYYAGEVITVDELNAGRFSGSEYLLFVCRSHVIVGEGPRANYTRFINHSTDANAYLVVSTRWKSARFEAVREIRPGDEVFFNYGEEYYPE